MERANTIKQNDASSNKRAVNFTRSEENMLILLVKKYAAIIENKKTDSCMNQKKNAIWAQIATEFNSAGGDTYRSLQILKNKYLNLKKKSMKKFSDEKKETYRTGGGPPVVCTNTEVDNAMKEIIGSRMTGLASQFDSDSTELDINIPAEEDPTVLENMYDLDHTYFMDEMDVSEHVHCDVELSDTANASTSKDLDIQQNDWSKYSVENLRTPVSNKLQVNKDVRKRDNTLKTKLSLWAKSKLDFVTVQQQCLLNESQQKMKHNEEKHREELRQKEEIHSMKMAILRLEKEKLEKEGTQ